MHIFWRHGPATAAAARDRLADGGPNLAYTTVATLVRILADKDFLRPLNDERPFVYEARQSYEDVSGRLLGDVIERVFGGSREELLLRLVGQGKLTAEERAALEALLEEDDA
jgi:predicted transcriptional regulator